MVRNPAPSAWRVSNSSLSLQDGKTVLSLSAIQADGAPLLAASYSAEVSADAAMGSIIASPTATEPRLVLGELKPGIYYLRLRAAAQAPDGEVYRFEIPGNWGQTVFDVGFALQKVR